MRYNKKLLSAALIICIILIFPFLFLNRRKEKEKASAEKVALKLWVQETVLDNESYFSHAIERYESRNSSVRIELKIISGDDLKAYRTMSTEIMNQNQPDLLSLSAVNFNQLAAETYLEDLNDFVKSFSDDYFFPNALEAGRHNGSQYGIAYGLDPEVLVYHRNFLEDLDIAPPNSLKTLSEFEQYLIPIDRKYRKDNLAKVAFAFPTLIKDGSFISTWLTADGRAEQEDISFLQKEDMRKGIQGLSKLGEKLERVPYRYGKTYTHPFFIGQSALSLEPLSQLYAAMEKDNNLKREIGVVPIEKTPFLRSYSSSQYLSVFSNTSHPKESQDFLSFLLGEEEVSYRYIHMNYPVMLMSLQKLYIEDSRFNNSNLLGYVQAADNYPISPQLKEYLENLDQAYDEIMNRSETQD